jgi:C4-dicarboxylate-specific signal transduction histidine kinase
VPKVIVEGLNREAAPGEVPAGLGLVLARDAMLLMGGSIRYATAPGETGARFRLSLPPAAQ